MTKRCFAQRVLRKGRITQLFAGLPPRLRRARLASLIWTTGLVRGCGSGCRGLCFCCDAGRRAVASDAAFDDNIGWAADHDQMFDVIPPDEDQAPPRIYSGCIEHLETRVAVAASAHERRRSAAAAQQPKNADKADKSEGDTKHRNHEPATIGTHQFFDHFRHSWFLRYAETIFFSLRQATAAFVKR